MHYLILVTILLISTFATVALYSNIGQADNYSAPVFINSEINPTKAHPGEKLHITTSIYDIFGLKKVQVKFFHEKGFDLINLSLSSGNLQNGIWEGNWEVHDTIEKEYKAIVTAFSISGFNSSIFHSWWDPLTWWNPNWLHRIPINVSNTVGSLFDYQIKIDLDSSNVGSSFDWNGDNESLRFTYYNSTSSTESVCSFWIEEWDSSGETATVWVNVTYLPGSSYSIFYMYYDNPSASSASSGEDTFYFFDHFQGSSLDTNKWQIDANSYSVSNSELRINVGGVSVRDPLSINLNDGYIVEGYIKYISSSGGYSGTLSGQSSHYTQGSNGGADATNLYMRNSGSTTVHRWTGDGSSSGYNCGNSNVWSSSNNVWYILGAEFYSGGVNLTRDRTATYGPYGCGWTKNINYISLGAFYGGSNYNIQDTVYDWVLIRKDVSQTPSYIIGLEEVAIPFQPTLSQPGNNTSINDNTPTFQWNDGGNTDNFTLLVDSETDLSDGDEWINVSLDSSIESYTIPGVDAFTEGKWFWKVVANNSQGKNYSNLRNFIVDITPPPSVNQNYPLDNATTNNNQVLFSWNSTTDSAVNTTQISNIECYQLQVDNNQDFSTPLVNENTSDNSTLSLTRQVVGDVYWRVRAWDQAGNAGAFSSVRTLTVFNFDFEASSTTIQLQRGDIDIITLSVNHDFGDIENVTLEKYWSSTIKPSAINVNFSITEDLVSFDSTLTFNCGSSATTGTFTCTINATSESGIKKTVNITVTVYSMLFSIECYPKTLSMIRSDSSTITISVDFDQGVLETVYLSGEWIDDTPSGVTVSFGAYSGTPSFDSLVTIKTSSSAEAGSFVYKITGESSGLTRSVNLYVNILTDLTLTAETDKTSYYKGQKIQISGVVKNENDDFVNKGTAIITLSNQDWNHQFNTTVLNGIYDTEYYITFDKPDGNWTISVKAKDSRGHVTLSSVNLTVAVLIPENYKHYSINVINPIPGQVFERGDTITITVSVTENSNKIVGLKVKSQTLAGEHIDFTETSPGYYSANYKLDYDCLIGNWNLYIEGSKYENEKLKAGFNYIDFHVQPVRPILELIEPKTNSFEVGETILLKVRAIYPNGNPVEEGIITADKPEGGTISFRKYGLNSYIADYTPIGESVGNWWIEIKAEDAYGNFGVLVGENIVINPTSLTSYALQYWWAAILSFFAICYVGIYFAFGKIQKFRLVNLKQETIEFEKMKREKAIQYFTKGEISRQTYDHLFQEYESKIANLTKKIRLLERKMKNKKSLFNLLKMRYKK
jgi:hypothetical protein